MSGPVDWLSRAASEQSRPSDPALDFCLWPYAPPQEAIPGALRSSALLFASFAAADAGPEMAHLIPRLQGRWGRFATVWGLKWGQGQASWEFYFYDYAREQRRYGVDDFVAVTGDLLACALPSPDRVPYFMFSVEIEPRHLTGAPLEQIDIYIGNPGSTVSSGICYGQTHTGRHLRNFYFFFDAETQSEDILDKLTESAFLKQESLHIPSLLWPEMEGAQTIVVANKQNRDSLYFSRIKVDQLIHFMERLAFPDALQRYVCENRDRLAHHLFDVGWDYDVGPQGQIVPSKGSIYGIV